MVDQIMQFRFQEGMSHPQCDHMSLDRRHVSELATFLVLVRSTEVQKKGLRSHIGRVKNLMEIYYLNL